MVIATVAVRAVRPSISLVRFDKSGVHAVVCGGRLISTERGGYRALGHKDPPQFTPGMFKDMFGVDFADWVAGDDDTVRVAEWKVGRLSDGKDGYGMFPCGRMRVFRKAFAENDPKAVVDWIRRWR